MRSEDLNYHHLHYFWVVAREGSLTQACRQLGVAPSTVSAQLKELEAHFGNALFDRLGRSLSLTEQGELAMEYADQIFALGHELDEVMVSGRSGRPQRLRVGVSDLVPKLVVRRLLEPALQGSEAVQLHVFGDRTDRLVADLSLHHVDLVIASEPVGTMGDRSARGLMLGWSGLTLFGTPTLADPVRDGFPASLDGAPMLLPAPGTQARRQLDAWFNAHNVLPLVVAEFADSGLLKAFGASGLGLFVAPSLVAEEVVRTYDVEAVGELEGLEEQYHALVPVREPEHPAVEAVLAGAGVALGTSASSTRP